MAVSAVVLARSCGTPLAGVRAGSPSSRRARASPRADPAPRPPRAVWKGADSAPSGFPQAGRTLLHAPGRHLALRRQVRTHGTGSGEVDSAGQGRGEDEEEEKSLLQVAGIIGLATTGSKFLGMAREMMIAAVFGVGPVVDAFNYAVILPGFFVSLLGGINGPLHSAIASTLSKRPRKEAAHLVEATSTIVGCVLLVASIALFLGAAPLIDLTAPGLLTSGAIGAQTRDIAVMQMRLMAPQAMIAGLTGVCFGSLSTVGSYVIPALSPAISSLAMMAAVLIHGFVAGPEAALGTAAVAGGAAIAVGSTVGAATQWLVQSTTQARKGMGAFMRARWLDPGESAAMREILAVLLPATVASGMLQIATYTDLYFASFIPNAAAGLGYANLLVMAPVGILSSSLLVPVLPLFARCSAPDQRPELRRRVREALILAMAATLPLTAMLVPLAGPTVKLVFERKAFDSAATALVAALLKCYAMGASAYLVRDVLVRVFYALGDGRVPFIVSGFAIAANVVLDYVLTRQLSFGAPGLVLATLSVGSVAILLWLLARRIGGLGLREFGRPVAILVGSSIASAGVVTGGHAALSPLGAFLASYVAKYAESKGGLVMWAAEGCALGGACLMGAVAFFGLCVAMGLPEAEAAVAAVRRKLGLGGGGAAPAAA